MADNNNSQNTFFEDDDAENANESDEKKLEEGYSSSSADEQGATAINKKTGLVVLSCLAVAVVVIVLVLRWTKSGDEEKNVSLPPPPSTWVPTWSPSMPPHDQTDIFGNNDQTTMVPTLTPIIDEDDERKQVITTARNVIHQMLGKTIQDAVFGNNDNEGEIINPTTKAALHQALDWILYHDPLLQELLLPIDGNSNRRYLSSSTTQQEENEYYSHAGQRFILAYLYFATTTAEQGWLSCNSPQPPAAAENNSTDESLSSFCLFQPIMSHGDDDGTHAPTQAARWLSDQHECDWAGVSCTNYNVTALHLGTCFPCV